METPKVILIILLLIFSCKQDTKFQEIEAAPESARKNITKSSKSLEDSIAEQMMEMFGEKNKTFHDMMKTDSLAGAMNTTFKLDNIEQLIEASNLSPIEKKAMAAAGAQLEAQRMTINNDEIYGDTQNLLESYFQQLQTVLEESGSDQQVKELQELMQKQGMSDAVANLGNGNKEVLTTKDRNIQQIRRTLAIDTSNYVEYEMTRHLMYGSKERIQVLNLLPTVNKAEGETLISNYLQITPNEMELLKQIPTRKDIISESMARQLLASKIPKPVQEHNASGKVSPRFKSMTEHFYQDQQGRAKEFIQKSEEARKSFYENNPGWYGENSESGNTYVDSRYQWIYLPLGALSFADRVVSHDIGRMGSNT